MMIDFLECLKKRRDEYKKVLLIMDGRLPETRDDREWRLLTAQFPYDRQFVNGVLFELTNLIKIIEGENCEHDVF